MKRPVDSRGKWTEYYDLYPDLPPKLVDVMIEENPFEIDLDDWPLVEALREFDQSRNQERLSQQLADLPAWTITEMGWRYVIDLFDRYELRRPAHRPSAPLYQPASIRDEWLARMIEEISQLTKTGVSVETAIDRVAEMYSFTGISSLSIAAAYKGRDGSFRRFKSR